MESIRCVSSAEAEQLMQSTALTVVDIRDPQSFAEARIPGACHLSDQNLQEFLTAADMDAPVLVYCYHGISSQNAAAFLLERGFDSVYSLDGGFEGWRQSGAIER
ncbi:MAG TPA: thiosulfate sulfurtransferase GlpE [Pseudomonadales bacterium]